MSEPALVEGDARRVALEGRLATVEGLESVKYVRVHGRVPQFKDKMKIRREESRYVKKGDF